MGKGYPTPIRVLGLGAIELVDLFKKTVFAVIEMPTQTGLAEMPWLTQCRGH